MTNSELIQHLITRLTERMDNLDDVSRSIDKSGEIYPSEQDQFRGRVKEIKRTIRFLTDFLNTVH